MGFSSKHYCAADFLHVSPAGPRSALLNVRLMTCSVQLHDFIAAVSGLVTRSYNTQPFLSLFLSLISFLTNNPD